MSAKRTSNEGAEPENRHPLRETGQATIQALFDKQKAYFATDATKSSGLIEPYTAIGSRGCRRRRRSGYQAGIAECLRMMAT